MVREANIVGYRPLTDEQRNGIRKMIKWLNTSFDGQYYVSGYSIYHSINKMEGLLLMGTYQLDDQKFLNKMRILYKDLNYGNKR
jgi:hypothetical protein